MNNNAEWDCKIYSAIKSANLSNPCHRCAKKTT